MTVTHKYVATIFSVLLVFSTPTHADQQIFARLVGIISPGIQYIPAGKLDRAQAEVSSQYRVSYDGKGRFSSIAFFNAGKRSNGAYFGTHEVRYRYGDTFIERRYYDKNNEPTSMWRHYYGGGDIHVERFELDSRGRKQSLGFRDTNNDVSSVVV